MRKNSEEQIDKDDMRVLAELQQNSDQSVSSIAKHLGFSQQKVSRCIKTMEKNHIIWGGTVIFDEQKIGLSHYVLMAKRNNKKVNENTIDQIVARKLEGFAAGLGIIIESSFYVHGEYDWVLTFTAKNINQAKKFSDSVFLLNPGIIEKISIMQTLMFIRKQYVLNPERKKLKELF
jgi:DNA-binding Lrp family transcriptional regulator